MTKTMPRKAFSLVELLVAVSIVVLLMALLGAAISSAQTRGAKDKAQATIMAIADVLQRHFSASESSRVGAIVATTERGTAIRRQITADMPDSWVDVNFMAINSNDFTSARQRGYVATWMAFPAANRRLPGDAGYPAPGLTGAALVQAGKDFVQYRFADSECLFMIVMQGGLADCLTCATLDSLPIGDTDSDGAPEFIDPWGMPIRYVLWPAGFEQPLGTKYFDQTKPFDGLPPAGAAGGTMRPLVFSGGPSTQSSTNVNDGSYLGLIPSSLCGDPADGTIAVLGGLAGTDDYRADNITNFSSEATP